MIRGFGRTLAEIQFNPGQHANEDLTTNVSYPQPIFHNTYGVGLISTHQ